MRDVAIIGVGMIPFGRRDEDTLMEMLAYASLKALDDAGLGDQSVDAVYVGNMGAGMLQHQSAIASSLVDRLNLLPAAADTVENGPASGGSAVKNGLLAVASGVLPLHLFGRHNYGARQALMLTPARFVQAAAPALYGVVLDRSAGLALLVSSGVCLIMFAMTFGLRQRPGL